MMRITTGTYAIGASAVVIAALVGFVVSSRSGADQFADCRSSAIVGGSGSVGGAFTLTDEDGRTVTDRDVLTKPSLVYFGYTYCPDICPADTARNAAAVDLLEEAGHEVTPVFISVDPDRDTPEALKQWTDYIHPRMIGLTGTPEQIRATAQAYRTIYRVPEDRADGNYLVDHMTQTYLMLPDAGFVEFYSRDTTPEDLARSAACFIEHSG